MGLRRNKANSGRSPVGRGQRDVGRGTNAPNEPNLVRAPRKGRGWAPDPAGARRRQTKPIARSGAPRRCPPALREGQVVCRKEVMVNGTCNRRRQNKANLPARPQTGVGQGSQQRSRRSGVLRQTNPIPDGRDAPPFQHSTIPGFQSDACCAKRTQLPEAGHRGGVRRGRVGRGMLYKQTQFLLLCRSGDRRSREGKTPPYKGGNCAKQTQFSPPAGRLGPWEEKMCETKPIWSRLHSATGWNGTKQSQFRRVRAGVGRQLCKTNPILARRAEPMALESATVCRPHPLHSLRALCGCDRAATAIECGKQCRGRRWIRWSAIARRKWHGDD